MVSCGCSEIQEVMTSNRNGTYMGKSKCILTIKTIVIMFDMVHNIWRI